MACTSETARSSSRAICRLERFRPIRYRHSTQSRWRPVAAGQDGAAQVVEAGATPRATVALPVRLDVVPTVTSDRGTAAARAADAVGPAVLPDQLEASRVIDQGRQVHQGWHGRYRGWREDPYSTAQRAPRHPRGDHPETR